MVENFNNQIREVICLCNSCGATASLYTRKKDISEKEKTFVCNNCMSKKSKRSWKDPQPEQGVLV
jgi:protein-arginine kinase activator protein McsA